MWEKNGLNSHKLSQNFNFLPLSDAPADCFNIVSIFHHSNKEFHITPQHGFILYGFQVAEFLKHRKLAFCFLLPPDPSFLSFPPMFSSLFKVSVENIWPQDTFDEYVDRAWRFCVQRASACVFVKVETAAGSSNLHDIYTAWMK